MDKNIKQILNELYQIDPTLKDQEEKLIKVIDELIKAKPEVEIDQVFLQKLRNELNQKATNLSVKKPTSNIFAILEKITYAFGGAVVTAVIMFMFSPIQMEEVSFNNAETMMIEEISMRTFDSIPSLKIGSSKEAMPQMAKAPYAESNDVGNADLHSLDESEAMMVMDDSEINFDVSRLIEFIKTFDLGLIETDNLEFVTITLKQGDEIFTIHFDNY